MNKKIIKIIFFILCGITSSVFKYMAIDNNMDKILMASIGGVLFASYYYIYFKLICKLEEGVSYSKKQILFALILLTSAIIVGIGY